MSNLENIFVTEGTPQLTFVHPPNFNEIYLDIRHDSKPVVIEGPSGTGKTSTVIKVLERVSRQGNYNYLTARKDSDLHEIIRLINQPNTGKYIIDDFHRLDELYQKKLADIAKIAADEGIDTKYPKLIFVGINQIGETLLQLSPDIAKRCGIHKIKHGTTENILELVSKGEKALNIKIQNPLSIYRESRGDYWLAQKLCQAACLRNGILEVQEERVTIKSNIRELRNGIIENLYHSYYNIIKEFCRGKRFRASNDAYYKLLQAASKQEKMPVDLNELANSSDDVFKHSINKVKEHRLKIHLESKDILNRNFFYDEHTKSFNVEDPAMQYFIKYLDWKKLYSDCGFTKQKTLYKYDIAISFAGQNRNLAKQISDQLLEHDVVVFYDELYEANYLGSTWSEEFKSIFSTESKYVVCLLDKYHKDKIWPTFERECFVPRVKEKEIIPIFLDDTPFVGLSQDLIGIKLENYYEQEISEDKISEIVKKLLLKLEFSGS